MEKLGSPEPAHLLPGAGPADGPSAAAKPPMGPEGDAELAAESSKLFRSACMRRWIPLAYREEIYHVLRLTGPLLLSRILNFLLPFVITIFCGHIGNAELAGYALASATINLTTAATGHGLAVACDTLISQTFGGKNLKRVGVILQRSSFILLLFCLPLWSLLINAHNLLLFVGQEDDVARIAQMYLIAYIPAIPAMFLHLLQVSYLQNQGIILPQMYTAGAANLINAAVNYVLIHRLDMGVIGSAIASSLSQITICLLLYGYIRWKKLHKNTWGGLSTECLQEWGSYMKLAIPSLFMVCFEWWFWEVGGFLAGTLGEEDLAAQHVIAEIGAITYMFPLGVHAAACVRVGNALGAGDTARALLTCKVCLTLAVVLAVIQGIAIAGCRHIAGYIFTTDEVIVSIVSGTLAYHVFIQFFDGLLCVSSGILIGAGMQRIAAAAGFVGYYVVGLPVGTLLVLKTNLRILGFWIGLLLCIILQVSFFLILIWKLNWKKVTKQAQLRAGKIAVLPRRPVSTLLNEAMVPDSSDTVQYNGEEASKADGYSPVNDQDHELKAGGGTEKAAGGEQGKDTPKPEAPLSITQLILRRGLLISFLVLCLAVGVACHFAFPAPEPSVRSSANMTLNWANDSTVMANDSTPTLLTPLELTTTL